MITHGELYLRKNEKPLRIGQGKSINSYSLKSVEHLTETNSINRKMYFSSLFIRWQRTHQVSDKCVQDKLGLTVNEFRQFREDELSITPSLIDKLVEVTGGSKQFWQNRWLQQKRSQGCNNEKI